MTVRYAERSFRPNTPIATPMKHLALALLIGTAIPLHAVLIVSDQFEDGAPGSPLVGLDSGIGWSDTWHPGGFNASNSSVETIGVGSLSYGGLPESGNHAAVGISTSIAGVARTFSQSIGTTNTTRYFSMLLEPEGTLGQGAFNGFFGLALEGTNGSFFVGKPGGGDLNSWVMETRGGSGQFSSGVGLQVGRTDLLVVKAEFFAGADRFTLYVNPTPGAPEPLTGTVKNGLDLGLASEATIYSTGAFSLDSFQIGDTFASVTAPAVVPEPGTAVFGIALLGLCGVGWNWRRKA